MTRQCKDCVFANQNKLREVIKDVISCINNEHIRLEQRLIAAEQSEQEAKAVNTQLQEWQDEDLRQIAGLKRELEILIKMANIIE